jgi:ankyrin repeat protein
MLPLKVSRFSAGVAGTEVATYDPRLSRAIADLMPDGYLEKDRLAGNSWMIEEEPREGERPEAPPTHSAAPDVSDEGAAEIARRNDEVMNEIYRVLAGIETPEEIAAAERAGKFSDRLLKRISAADARALLARGADPNFADDAGQTALMHAAFPPFDRERFHLLVQARADVQACRNDGFTGLHLACAGGEAEAAQEWVQAGADVSARTPEGATPLMLAVTRPRIVRRLLAAGADVNAADEEGHSPLVYAIVRQAYLDDQCGLEALQVLLDAGANVNQPDCEGVTPLEHARRALAQAEVEADVVHAIHRKDDPSPRPMSSDERLAASIVDLIASVGGHP